MEQTFPCQICKAVLPLDSFHKDRTRLNGHSPKCKACKRAKSAAYRKTKDWAAYQRVRLQDDSKRSSKNAQQKAWHQRNPLATQAYADLHRALNAGSIVRPKECSDCKQVCKPEAHHEDYEKALDVIWLCRPCHEARHHQ